MKKHERRGRPNKPGEGHVKKRGRASPYSSAALPPGGGHGLKRDLLCLHHQKDLDIADVGVCGPCFKEGVALLKGVVAIAGV